MSATETRSPGKPFLVGKNLTKVYPGVRALHDVDGAIMPGVVLGLVGKNGAGKSTLLKVFAGAVQPDEGQIFIDGEEVTLHSPHDATKRGLAFVHQELTDVPNLSVAENIELGLGYPKRMGVFVNQRALRRKTREVLARLEVNIDPATPAGALSLADRRLVMIARGLAADARLLVLDEPSASLTEDEIRHLHAVVRSLKSSGVAIIYVSHRLDEILELTDFVGVMRDGELVYNARTRDVSMTKLIEEITGSLDAAPERRDPRKVETPGEELLRVEGLSTADGVNDASFTLRKGDLLGIAGLVGAGRTELVRAIFGADRATSGTVHVHGSERTIRSPRDGLRAGIVLLPEDRRQQGTVQSFSVRKNVTLPGLKRYRRGPLPLPKVGAERKSTRELVERLNIKVAHVEHPVRYLSGGNQQKVVLAKWLESGADVFIFDEPTHGIDVEGKEDVYNLMEHLAESGKGVIFISSEFSELVGACNRVVVMREGGVVGELEGDAITDAALVERCYAD
jgi:ABC-type sugar transport system ATPase subunit